MIDVQTADLTQYPLRWYSEDFQARVLLWGETRSVICIDYGMWKDTRCVDTESLHETKEEFAQWKYNERFPPGQLVGFHETGSDWGVGLVLETMKIGNDIKLLVGEEVRSIEVWRIFKLREDHSPQAK